MIADSVPWKDRLYSDLVRLRKRLRSVDENDDGYDDVELFAFTSAFVIRKLIDSFRLSVEAEFCKVLATAYPTRRVDLSGCEVPDIARYFRLMNGVHVEVDVRDLCNELIHSHHFMVTSSERATHWAIFFSSDTNRHSRALRIPLTRFTRLVQFVAEDEWDMQSRRFEISNKVYGPSHDLKCRPLDDGSSGTCAKRRQLQSAETYFAHLEQLIARRMNYASARREAAKMYLRRRYGGQITLR